MAGRRGRASCGSQADSLDLVRLPAAAGPRPLLGSTHYGIADLDEARAYLAHPILRARLTEAIDLLLAAPGTDPERILGGIDATKVRSSMTLFHRADPSEPRFGAVLDRFYGGSPDPVTDERLRG